MIELTYLAFNPRFVESITQPEETDVADHGWKITITMQSGATRNQFFETKDAAVTVRENYMEQVDQTNGG